MSELRKLTHVWLEAMQYLTCYTTLKSFQLFPFIIHIQNLEIHSLLWSTGLK